MTYKLTNDNNCIMKLPSRTIIPKDNSNRMYIDYLKWLEAGNEPEPVDVPEVVYSITPESKLLTVGDTMDIIVTGTAGDYVITVNDEPHDVEIDETGIEAIELPATDAGVYIIKGTGLLGACVAKVEVY